MSGRLCTFCALFLATTHPLIYLSSRAVVSPIMWLAQTKWQQVCGSEHLRGAPLTSPVCLRWFSDRNLVILKNGG